MADAPTPAVAMGETPNPPAQPVPPAIGTPAWMEGLLRARLGPGAVLGEIVFEGRFVHLRGARLPLGPRASLVVTHAAVELGAGLPLGELPLSARLALLRCELRLDGARPFVLPVQFTAGDGDEEAWAHGTLRLGGSAWVESTLSLRPSGWSLGGDRLVAEGPLVPPGLSQVRARGLPLSLFPPLGGGLTLSGALDADLTASGVEIRGQVSAAELHLRRAGGAWVRLAEVSVELDANRRRLRYRDLQATLSAAGGGDTGRLRGWGRVPLAPASTEAGIPLLALQLEGAGAALLAALAGPRAPDLPPDLSLTGELAVSAQGATSGAFAVETPRSALLLRLALGEGGALLGSTLRGRLAAADAVTIGLLRGPVRPRAADTVTVDARLTGTLARPGITGRLAAARVSLEIRRREGGSPPSPALEIEDASVLLDVGPDGLAWHQLGGRFYGGRVTSSGRLGRGTGALAATLAWSDVLLDALPAWAPGEPAVGALLAGKGSGELRFERESLSDTALSAQGRVSVAEPVYHFVRRFAPVLARYGLPPVSRRGTGPLAADLRLSRGELVVEPIAAGVEGIDVDGELRMREGGLLGRVRIRLLESYVSRSALLSIPAALSGEVTIPVYLSGLPGALQVQTDALEILDGLLTGSRVGEAVKSVLDGLRGVARSRWGGRR